ncbi:hypothetical protein AMATHDRAFT_4535 [Amanita thiersii Skay4041]|uniref:Uncharacterized protein n=1 Tax=Amanita thiersii Skay4041 TaxID=703135 RepID=A0A2A9NGW4_9AGAR|nr:hypothetical protein AMATHDRAFT_4535 [Amanita thiersii Skay4041]
MSNRIEDVESRLQKVEKDFDELNASYSHVDAEEEGDDDDDDDDQEEEEAYGGDKEEDDDGRKD